jgi:hypothetical protein
MNKKAKAITMTMRTKITGMKDLIYGEKDRQKMTVFDEIMEAYQNFDIVSSAYIEKLKEEFNYENNVKKNVY